MAGPYARNAPARAFEEHRGRMPAAADLPPFPG